MKQIGFIGMLVLVDCDYVWEGNYITISAVGGSPFGFEQTGIFAFAVNFPLDHTRLNFGA